MIFSPLEDPRRSQSALQPCCMNSFPTMRAFCHGTDHSPLRSLHLRSICVMLFRPRLVDTQRTDPFLLPEGRREQEAELDSNRCLVSLSPTSRASSRRNQVLQKRIRKYSLYFIKKLRRCTRRQSPSRHALPTSSSYVPAPDEKTDTWID